ncbi:MAG: TIGR02757 family protein [Acidobacteriota bacterium]|nr:TIGR02757 family protein [Acidobacteriota bacterium]MDE2711582.1 TIGR02757 family protein [Acidobacteriota bacterium]MXW70054.1 TIGR02757 family protein [Acidobacteriota bacterium]MXX87576.1 TIGR02757 family protein [Acidobacteriota bacterium]MYE44699.1 TIGR02757 family protein [Acidobacteriota bacterium]
MPPRGWEDAVERVFRRHGAGSLDSDPLQFPRRFRRADDREIAAYFAASLSYGNARAVCSSLERVFAWVGPHPARFVREFEPRREAAALGRFRHRWSSAGDLVRLAVMLRGILGQHGTLQALFGRGVVRGPGGRTDLAATIGRFREAALAYDETPPEDDLSRPGPRYFFPDPHTSAAKRTTMFLRWVVRPDDGLDLGLWDCLHPRDLVAPLDTHMFQIARQLHLTRRKTPAWRAALDLTRGLRRLDPEDPVKYDFALSRLGIVEGCPRHRRSEPCELCGLLGRGKRRRN